jgi:hypothetical protein
MLYSFARVSAVLKPKVDDYYHNGARRRLKLHEKGGKEHEMPVHHLLEQILDEYIVAAGLQSRQPLFQSVNSLGTAVTGRAHNRYNAWAAIRKRAKAAVFSPPSDVTLGGQPASLDKGRDYTERGGTNPNVTFDPKPCRRSAQPTLNLLFFTPRHGAVTATKGRFGLLGGFLYIFPHRARDAVTATALF